MIIALCIIGYLLMIGAFCLWDSWIGMPVNWNSYGSESPPLGIAAIGWPIAIPIVALIGFVNYLDEAKEKRKKQDKQKQKIRIAAEEELEKYNQEVEEEVQKILHERKNSNQA